MSYKNKTLITGLAIGGFASLLASVFEAVSHPGGSWLKLVGTIGLGIVLLGTGTIIFARMFREAANRLKKLRLLDETIAGRFAPKYRSNKKKHEGLFAEIEYLDKDHQRKINALMANELVMHSTKEIIPQDEDPCYLPSRLVQIRKAPFDIYGYSNCEMLDFSGGSWWTVKTIDKRYSLVSIMYAFGKPSESAIANRILNSFLNGQIGQFTDDPKRNDKPFDLRSMLYRLNDLADKDPIVPKGRFITVRLALLDSESGEITLAHAGSNEYIRRCSGSSGVSLEALPNTPAIGICANELIEYKEPFSQKKLKIGGNGFLIFTEGCFEDIQRPTGKTSSREFSMPGGEVQKSVSSEEEEFGTERITAILNAIIAKSKFRMNKENASPAEIDLEFDYSTDDGSLEYKVLAFVAAERIFRMYPDPKADDGDTVIVEAKVDAFLAKTFSHYGAFCRYKDISPEGWGEKYIAYRRIKEYDQTQNFTILALASSFADADAPEVPEEIEAEPEELLPIDMMESDEHEELEELEELEESEFAEPDDLEELPGEDEGHIDG